MKEEFITIDELSKISRVKVNKRSAYVKKGILSYEKQDENTGRRYYNKNKASRNTNMPSWVFLIFKK